MGQCGSLRFLSDRNEQVDRLCVGGIFVKESATITSCLERI